MNFRLLLLLVIITGCCEQHAVVKTEHIADYNVSTLFIKDNCTVYRFVDDGRYRYFTDCTDVTFDHLEHHGKTTEEVSETNTTRHHKEYK